MESRDPDPPAETLPADTDAAAAARDRSAAAEKVRSFPQTPGVYLMKDAAGRVLYVG
jgi:excinuclease ABC subunit C